eukprot:scaffold17595_cov113-Cylindrotheca_fusiformis.AAC.5
MPSTTPIERSGHNRDALTHHVDMRKKGLFTRHSQFSFCATRSVGVRQQELIFYKFTIAQEN